MKRCLLFFSSFLIFQLNAMYCEGGRGFTREEMRIYNDNRASSVNLQKFLEERKEMSQMKTADFLRNVSELANLVENNEALANRDFSSVPELVANVLIDEALLSIILVTDFVKNVVKNRLIQLKNGNNANAVRIVNDFIRRGILSN